MKKEKLSVCAIVPARSGSKTIKNKNILKLNGYPMLAYSIVAAKKSKLVDKVVFSSDLTKYLKIAKKYKPDILHHRSRQNSSSKARDIDFLNEIYMYLKKKENYNPQIFALIRPNTPTRIVKDIDDSIKFFLKNYNFYTGLRSISQMSETSYKTFYLKNKKLCSVIGNKFNIENLNRPKEDFKNTYYGNGCIDLIKTSNLSKGITHGNKVYGFITKNIYIDVDYKNDIKLAKYFIKEKKYLSIKNDKKY
tara:strand:+ start:44 stop:790 length:747 start_codon:yes stop_codon:yes gene_type:complete